MNVEMVRNDLLTPLQAVTGVIEARQTLPILSHVLIELTDGQLTATASDAVLQVSASVTTEYTGEPKSFTASADKLVAILRQLPADATVGLQLHGARLRVVRGDGSFNQATMAAADYP